ncbi:uncharacterized protein [Onthophagus taurus]|uniref:uncharacterized protein n=1 Tax=Onthophagus taurus TaxID=166361 RepID=UPI0039BEAF52
MKNLIRRTLENLSKLLNLLLNVQIEPKHFRHAKFDQSDDETVMIFWCLLKKLTKNTINSSVDDVKRIFHSLKYKSLRFYCLPSDMTQGSYQLLLAFGYLINNGFLYDYLKENVYKETLKPISHTYKSHRLDLNWNKDELTKKQTIEWIKGKIKINEKIIEETNIAIDKFVSQLNKDVTKPLGKLTLMQWLAFGKDKRYEREFLCDIDKKIMILECYEKFIQMERVFWDWMSSVHQMNSGDVLNYDEILKFTELILKEQIKKEKMVLFKLTE